MTTKRVYSPEQKKQRAEYQAYRRKNDPERMRDISRRSERKRKLRESYGLTLEEYNTILDAQNNLCAICKQINTSSRDWHVDHCHKTGKVRGILCSHCNLMLGHATDNVLTLHSAINYLKGI
mgnify:FL=1